MTSSHSMYKHPSKIAKASPISKAVSKYERKVRKKKLEIYKLFNRLAVLKDQRRHQTELIKIIRAKDEDFFQECLKEKDRLFGKTKKARELRIEHLEKNYHPGGESNINGWIGEQLKKEKENERNK